MDMFGEPMIPKQVKITPFAFFVRRDVLLGYERRARRSESGFVVPEEGEEGGEYMLDGEWVEWVDKKDDKREGDGEERIILYLHVSLLFILLAGSGKLIILNPIF